MLFRSPWPDATDADRCRYLLARLGDMPRPWLAHFHASVALARPDGRLHLAAGECSGEIIPDERGSNGFGYDPIFFIPPLGRCMAELEMWEKNQVSHRSRAIRNAEATLREWLDLESGESGIVS